MLHSNGGKNHLEMFNNLKQRIGILIKRSVSSSLNSVLSVPNQTNDPSYDISENACSAPAVSQEFQLTDSVETINFDQNENSSLLLPVDTSQSQKLEQSQLEDWFGSGSKNSNSASETLHYDWDNMIEFEKKLILLDSQCDDNIDSLPLFFDLDQLSNNNLLKLMIKETPRIEEWKKLTKAHLPFWRERVEKLFQLA